jgi:hypothetical protein
MSAKTIALISLLFLGVGCAKSEDPYPCYEAPVTTDSTATILVIGDSISIGYLPTVKADMPTYEFIHNPCNAMNTVHTKGHLDAWLALRPTFKAITFNNGLWDIAIAVMNELSIPVLDLYTYGQSISGLQLPHDVHWTPAGSAALGHQVSTELLNQGI